MERKSNTVFRNLAIAGVIILAIVGFSFFANDDRGFADQIEIIVINDPTARTAALLRAVGV